MRDNLRLPPLAVGRWRGVPMNAVRQYTILLNLKRVRP